MYDEKWLVICPVKCCTMEVIGLDSVFGCISTVLGVWS